MYNFSIARYNKVYKVVLLIIVGAFVIILQKGYAIPWLSDI